VVADVELSVGRHDKVNLVLGVVVPANRAKGVSVAPGGKGFPVSDMDQLKVELHGVLPVSSVSIRCVAASILLPTMILFLSSPGKPSHDASPHDLILF
jgi:hypothetical protein